MLKVIETGDGSHSLFNVELNETYHSRHGAIQESLHVFIKNGLHYLKCNTGDAIKILEIGFGTGLNALLTLRESIETNLNIEYHTIEEFPVDHEILKTLNYGKLVFADQEELFLELHETPWNKSIALSPRFTLFKKRMDILAQEDLGFGKYDLIYFDAFAPSRQPEIWNLKILTNVIRAMREGGVFVTYCARGQLKRDLRSLNMKVESIAGPPGKKEMVRSVLFPKF